jgi:hypothetical protein
MTCPKCSFVQPAADFCEACGVVILKFLKRQWEEEQLAKQLEENLQAAEENKADKPAETTLKEPVQPSAKPSASTTEAPEPSDNLEDAFTFVEEPTVASQTDAPQEPALEIPPGPSPGTMTCPKCSFVQPKADLCEACGVVVIKFLQRQAAERQQQAATSANEEDNDKESDLATPTDSSSETTSEPAPPGEQEPPHKLFESLWPRSFALLRNRLSTLLPLWLVSMILLGALFSYYDQLAISLGVLYATLFSLLAPLILLSFVVECTLLILLDEYIPLRPALAIAIIRFPQFFWLNLVLSVTLIGSFMGLLVPGYFFSRWFCLAPLCFAAEETRGLSSLLRSRAYVAGREKQVGKYLFPALLPALAAVIALFLLPGATKGLSLLGTIPLLAVCTELYKDMAESRPVLSYEDTISQRLQWPAMSFGGFLVFTILITLGLGEARIRGGVHAVLLHTEIITPHEQVVTEEPSAVVRKFGSGVFELQISGYQATVYLNGERIQNHAQGISQQKTFSTPVTLKQGRNMVAIQYSAMEGQTDREMVFKVVHLDVHDLKEKDFGTWRLDDRGGLRHFEFHYKGRIQPAK